MDDNFIELSTLLLGVNFTPGAMSYALALVPGNNPSFQNHLLHQNPAPGRKYFYLAGYFISGV